MDKETTILIVEDEPRIRTGLRDFLEFHHFQTATAEDGLEAERIVDHRRFDLILLDLMLPKISGEQLCQKWRQSGLTTPIIMLTAKGMEKEKIDGLNLGADDYVTKPFSLEELLARINAILRRTEPGRGVGQKFPFGPWSVDMPNLKIATSKKTVELSPRQAELIRFFAANPNRVIPRGELYSRVWGESMEDIETRTVDMHVAKLRALIEDDPTDPRLIKTVRGVGYLYEASAGDDCASGGSHREQRGG
ncbi:MAG: response regulator transcription factor [Phycisphaerae bacterium]|nr:response regulator transcription factor [Phycisphaerae bacterium]